MIRRFTLPAVLATWRTQMVDLSADGKRLLVQCNESGTMQLFDVLLSTGERRRVTDLTEPVTGMYVPGGDGLVLQMDEGGDERFQLYRWQHEQLQPLSVHPGAMQILGAIDRAGMRLAYASNRRNLTDFDIYIRELHGEGEVCVYSAGGLCQVHDFSPDGRWLLLSRNGDRPMDNDLLLVDIWGSGWTCLTSHGDAAVHLAPTWLPDSSGFIFSTNEDREFLTPARCELAGGWRFIAEASADTTCSICADGSSLCLVTHEDGEDRCRVVDASTLRTRWEVLLPEPGIVSQFVPPPRLTEDGRSCFFTLTSAREAGDVWVAQGPRGGARRVTSTTRSVPPSALVAPSRHRIKSLDGEPFSVFLYRSPNALGPWPVVVDLHGGPESQALLAFNPVTQFLVAQGIAVAVPNVRGSTGYGKRFYGLDDRERRLDTLGDLAALHRWLASQGADERRMGLLGASYGGYLTLMGLALQPELWACGVSTVGISNLITFLEGTAPYRRRHRELEYGTLGGDRDFLVHASPMTHAGRIRCPLLLIHGANDQRVPLHEAEQMHAVLQARGIECDLIVYPDEGHGVSRFSNRLDAYERTGDFLSRTLLSGPVTSLRQRPS